MAIMKNKENDEIIIEVIIHCKTKIGLYALSSIVLKYRKQKFSECRSTVDKFVLIMEMEIHLLT